jgi:hypothetical protein
MLSLCCVFFLLTACKATDYAKSTTDYVKNKATDYGLLEPTETNETGTGTKVAAGATGCVVGGAAGFFATKALGKYMKENGDYVDPEELRAASVMVAGLGCVVGGAVAIRIIQNMDAKSKQAQENAWLTAQKQAQSQKVSTTAPSMAAWESPTMDGNVSITDPVTDVNGSECATRKNYYRTKNGEEAEQFITVCKDSSGSYVPVPT